MTHSSEHSRASCCHAANKIAHFSGIVISIIATRAEPCQERKFVKHNALPFVASSQAKHGLG